MAINLRFSAVPKQANASRRNYHTDIWFDCAARAASPRMQTPAHRAQWVSANLEQTNRCRQDTKSKYVTTRVIIHCPSRTQHNVFSLLFNQRAALPSSCSVPVLRPAQRSALSSVGEQSKKKTTNGTFVRLIFWGEYKTQTMTLYFIMGCPLCLDPYWTHIVVLWTRPLCFFYAVQM